MCHTSVICSNHISKLKYPVQRYHWKEETMKRLYICSAVIGVVALGIAGAASAGEYKNADALSVAQGKPKRTDCSIKEDVDTKTYCFGDEAANAKANVAKADTYWQPCKEGIAEYMYCD